MRYQAAIHSAGTGNRIPPHCQCVGAAPECSQAHLSPSRHDGFGNTRFAFGERLKCSWRRSRNCRTVGGQARPWRRLLPGWARCGERSFCQVPRPFCGFNQVRPHHIRRTPRSSQRRSFCRTGRAGWSVYFPCGSNKTGNYAASDTTTGQSGRSDRASAGSGCAGLRHGKEFSSTQCDRFSGGCKLTGRSPAAKAGSARREMKHGLV